MPKEVSTLVQMELQEIQQSLSTYPYGLGKMASAYSFHLRDLTQR